MKHTPRPPLRGFARQAGEVKLGDGFYVSIDESGMIRLRAPQHGRDHIIHLSEQSLDAFLAWLCECRETLLADERTAQ